VSGSASACVTCEANGAPTEGMTGTCRSRGGVLCFGHLRAHEKDCAEACLPLHCAGRL